jgi:hypothetical protein
MNFGSSTRLVQFLAWLCVTGRLARECRSLRPRPLPHRRPHRPRRPHRHTPRPPRPHSRPPIRPLLLAPCHQLLLQRVLLWQRPQEEALKAGAKVPKLNRYRPSTVRFEHLTFSYEIVCVASEHSMVLAIFVSFAGSQASGTLFLRGKTLHCNPNTNSFNRHQR